MSSGCSLFKIPGNSCFSKSVTQKHVLLNPKPLPLIVQLYWNPKTNQANYSNSRFQTIEYFGILNKAEKQQQQQQQQKFENYIIVKLTKPWTPEIFMECYCVERSKPIRRQITKPQTATVISLWFWGLLAYPELYCDWPVHNQHSWKFSFVHVFLSLTVNALECSWISWVVGSGSCSGCGQTETANWSLPQGDEEVNQLLTVNLFYVIRSTIPMISGDL